MAKAAQPMCIPFPAIFFKLLSVAASKDLTSLLMRLLDDDWESCKMLTGNQQLFQKQGHDVPTKRQFQEHWHCLPCKGTQGMPASLCPSNIASSCETLVWVFLIYNHCAGHSKIKQSQGPIQQKNKYTMKGKNLYFANCQWPNISVCGQGKKCSVNGLSAFAIFWIAGQIIPLLPRLHILIQLQVPLSRRAQFWWHVFRWGGSFKKLRCKLQWRSCWHQKDISQLLKWKVAVPVNS